MKFRIIKITNAGNNHPRLTVPRGINSCMGFTVSARPIEARKSGKLKSIVVPMAALNTIPEAYFSGNTFSKIRTIVMG